MLQDETSSAEGFFSSQPVLHDWYTKGHGMCCPICGESACNRSLATKNIARYYKISDLVT